MRRLVQRRGREVLGTVERRRLRQLDEVEARAVERPVPADPHYGLAVGQDQVGRLGPAPRHLPGIGCDIGWDALDLRPVEHGVGPQHRDRFSAVFCVRRGIPVLHQHALEEEHRGAALALADLPAAVGRLLVGAEPRVAAEREAGHRQQQHVDTVVAPTRGGVHRHPRGAVLPGLVPGSGPGFQSGDDPVRHFLVVVAPVGEGLAAAVLHHGVCLSGFFQPLPRPAWWLPVQRRALARDRRRLRRGPTLCRRQPPRGSSPILSIAPSHFPVLPQSSFLHFVPCTSR